MKKILSLLVALVMVLSLGSALAEEPVEIEYYFGLGGNLGNLFLKLIDEYNASQSKVHVTGVQFADYSVTKQNYQAALAAGKAPACMHTQLGNIPVFEDYLEPLNEYYKDEEFNADDLLAGCVACMYGTDGETLYGVPLFATTQLMYYRVDAFEGYDIEETFSTWQNLYKVMQEITKKDENGKTTFYGWEPMWGGGNYLDAVQSAGGTLFTDEECKHVNFLAQEWIDVMTFYSDAFKDGYMMFNHGGTGWEYWYANIDDVLQGRAAGYTGSAGDMGDLDFSIVAAHPQPGFGDHAAQPQTDAHLFVISKSASDEEKAAAWDFAKFLSSGHSQGQISMTSGYVVTRQSALEDPDFAAYVEANPQALQAIEAVNIAIRQHVDPTGGKVDDAYNDMVDNILLEGMDVIEALTIAQEEAQSALDEYWADQE